MILSRYNGLSALSCRSRHLGSKPGPVSVLCSWEKHFTHSATVGTGECRGRLGRGVGGGVVMIWPLHAIFVQTILHLWVLITSSLQSIVME